MKSIVLLFFAFASFILPVFGQPGLISTPEYSFTRINLGETHRQFFVEDIIRDSTGFMWFATRDGLYRYDGKAVRFFQSSINDFTSLQNNSINGLCIDKQKNLWVVTGNALHKYNALKENFDVYMLPKPEDKSDGNNIMSQIMADNNKNIWIATWDRGLLKFDTKTRKFKQFGKKTFNTNTVRAVMQDRMNTIWIASHNGLYIYNPQTDSFEEFSFLRTQAPNKNFTQLNTFYEDKQGVIWIGSNNGIIKFERLSASISFLPIANTSAQNDKNIVEAFYDDQKGNIWVGTRDGLNIFSKTQNKIIKTLIGNKRDEDGLISSDIRALYDDKRGNLWIGTHSGGINKYSLLKNTFFTKTLDSDEIGDNRIFSIFQSKKDELWLGTENGLYLLNPTTNRIKSYNNVPVLRSVLVKGITGDKDGNLWIGTDKDGLIRFDPKTLATRQLLFNSEKPVTFSSNDIWATYLDSKGKLWLCKSGNGLVCYDPLTNTNVTYTNNPADSKSISSNTTGCIVEDYKGRFWIGTSSQGLNCLDPKTGKSERFFQDKNNSNSLSNNTVSCLYFDKQNRLWIGTDDGLDVLDIDKKTFQHYGEKDGLDVLHIRSIAIDRNGNIWVSTTSGLFKRDILSGRFKKYTTVDGLPSDQFLPCSIFVNDQGIIYLGTENGLAYFDPLKIEVNPYIPNVVLTNFKLFNKNVAIGNILPQSIVSLKELNLSFKDNFIMFEFASLDFQNPVKNKYSWYLEGLEKTWNNPVSQNTAVYNNLAPGTYTLKVKASNNDDVWNEKGYEIRIKINPPFYLTTWFKIVFIFVVIALIFAYNYYRIKKIRRQNAILEKTVAKRTQTINIQKEALEKANHDLSNQKDEIISQANQLREYNSNLQEQQEKIKEQTLRLQELDKVKTQFFTNISHEFRTPLTLIIGPLDKLLKEVENELLKNQYEVMLRNAHRLLRLINQLLDLSRLDAGHLKLFVTLGNVSEYLRKISDTFILRAERQNIFYQFDAPAIPVSGYFDWDKVEKIVYNLLSNAFKNTPDGGSILISVKNDMLTSENFPSLNDISCIIIRVADTGTGIPETMQDHVFERFYRAENSNSMPGAGIGLSLTKELVLTHYGNIRVVSEPGKGAEFIVTLPIDKRCFSDSETSETPNTHIESNLKALQIIESANSNDKQAEISSNQEEVVERPVILIIEDDKDLNEFLANHFSGEYSVKSAYNGTEGLNTALDCMPDLILSDIMLPGDDGITISRILKNNELTSHIPIILLTAKDTENEKIAGLETGADDYITKPFEVGVLDIRIKNLIGQRKKLMERFSRIVTLQPTNIKVNRADENFLQKTMDTIEKNMENPSFDVELFTREIGISRTLLYRKVRALTDQSINDFIRSVRLKRAAQLLQSGTYNVTEAAMRAGFTNQSYFSKCFEQQFGELPSKYASKYKTN